MIGVKVLKDWNVRFEQVIRDIDRDWSVRLDRFEQDSRDRDAEQDRELSRMDSKLDNLIQLHARLEAFKDMTLCIVRSALGFMIGVIGSFVLFKV